MRCDRLIQYPSLTSSLPDSSRRDRARYRCTMLHDYRPRQFCLASHERSAASNRPAKHAIALADDTPHDVVRLNVKCHFHVGLSKQNIRPDGPVGCMISRSENQYRRCLRILPLFENSVTAQHPTGAALQTTGRIKMNVAGVILLIIPAGQALINLPNTLIWDLPPE